MNFNAIRAAFKQKSIHFLADPQWIIPSIITPFLFTLVVLWIYPEVTGPVVLQAVLGGGVLGMWGNTLFESSFTISFDRTNGTLEPIIASPTSLSDIIIGRSIFNAFIGLLNALLVFVVAELLFQTEVTIKDPAMFFVTLILVLFSLASIGMIFAAVFVFSRRASVVSSIMEYPIYVLCGALVPITYLPSWTNPISMALGPTWGVEALKMAAIDGYEATMGFDMWACILFMILLSAAYVIVAALLMSRVERNIRETGSATRY